MATTKAQRSAPEKFLRNYIVSLKRLQGSDGPRSAADKDFPKQNYVITAANQLPATGEEGNAQNIPIGFKFTVNGIAYNKLYITNAGYVVLVDPGSGDLTFDYTDVLDDSIGIGVFDSINNAIIKDEFTYNHILLAPWFGFLTRPVAQTMDELQQLSYASEITTALEQNILQGKYVANFPYDLVDHGVRYMNVFDPAKGKCLLIRSTCYSASFPVPYRIKYEIALFESGRIEYRYWPFKEYDADGALTTALVATCGIFWPGQIFAAKDNFRDFAPLLDYDKKSRRMSEFGGAADDLSYSEDNTYWAPGGTPTTTFYSSMLGIENWPKNGAIITMAPPVNTAKILPRKIIGAIASTRQIVSSPGMYDDRKSIPYLSGTTIHMPSTLPSRLLNDFDIDASLLQSLFVSGSDSQPSNMLKVANANVNRSAVNSILEQLTALERSKPGDTSFNEAQKNYEATSSTSAFYTTGSSVEEFGAGFSSPLKSKTQILLSLPVNRQTSMPSLTSSMYYYDESLLQWIMPHPSGSRNIGEVRSDASDADNTLAFEHRDSNMSKAINSYRVTATSIGFDAIGRKIVSGSSTVASDVYGNFYTSDPALGSVLNVSGSASTSDYFYYQLFGYRKQYGDEAISREYSKSVWIAREYVPNKSQKIELSITEPFLLEKLNVKLPLLINGEWFNDMTTCKRGVTVDDTYSNLGSGFNANLSGRFKGPIDFGGPAITFALVCHRGFGNVNYMDLIASGTITHTKDARAEVVLQKDAGAQGYSLRPQGFYSFSNPSVVIDGGASNSFDGKVSMNITPAIAGGITIARIDMSNLSSSYTAVGTIDPVKVSSNRDRVVQLLTTEFLPTFATPANNYSQRTYSADENFYPKRSPLVIVQNVSPLSRGSTGVEFNGNSILGGTIASYAAEQIIKNPLYVAPTGSLPSAYTTKIDGDANFTCDAVSVYSLVDNQKSPYLLLPGDKLTLILSKTRPVIHKVTYGKNPESELDVFGVRYFEHALLTGSHGTVMLNTGSIDLTLYGSYVRQGMEFNP